MKKNFESEIKKVFEEFSIEKRTKLLNELLTKALDLNQTAEISDNFCDFIQTTQEPVEKILSLFNQSNSKNYSVLMRILSKISNIHDPFYKRYSLNSFNNFETLDWIKDLEDGDKFDVVRHDKEIGLKYWAAAEVLTNSKNGTIQYSFIDQKGEKTNEIDSKKWHEELSEYNTKSRESYSWRSKVKENDKIDVYIDGVWTEKVVKELVKKSNTVTNFVKIKHNNEIYTFNIYSCEIAKNGSKSSTKGLKRLDPNTVYAVLRHDNNENEPKLVHILNQIGKAGLYHKFYDILTHPENYNVTIEDIKIIIKVLGKSGHFLHTDFYQEYLVPTVKALEENFKFFYERDILAASRCGIEEIFYSFLEFTKKGYALKQRVEKMFTLAFDLSSCLVKNREFFTKAYGIKILLDIYVKWKKGGVIIFDKTEELFKEFVDKYKDSYENIRYSDLENTNFQRIEIFLGKLISSDENLERISIECNRNLAFIKYDNHSSSKGITLYDLELSGWQ